MSTISSDRENCRLTSSAPLLQTKINIPGRPAGLVGRPDLTSLLEGEVFRHRLTLVSAPPGYGKTTTLADWSRTSRSQIAWLSLSSDDDEFERFLRYVLAAWERIDLGVAESEFGILLSSQGADPQDLLAAFLNQAGRLADDLALVLDDYHLIESEAIHNGIAFWIDNLPPNVHFVISTRSQPPLPLHRYRARGQLTELGPDQLRFNQRESADFLVNRMGLDLPDDRLVELQERLEGWAAGLQLAALGSSARSSEASPPVSITGKQRYLADYLSRDVLELLDPGLQDFLLSTSILDRMCAELCNVVAERDDGQELLEKLERENLFLQALDDRREWFRYHNLFGDFLRSELEERRGTDLPELHRRAADWFERHGMPEPAFQHALRSGDSTKLLEIGDRHIPIKISRGELNLVEDWIGSIPSDWYERHPMLVLGRAAYYAMRGDFQSAISDLQSVEKGLAEADPREAGIARGRLSAFYCATACMQNDVEAAQAFGDRASSELSDEDIFYHGMINGSLGDTYRSIGRWANAERHYLLALEYSQNSAIRFMGIHAYGGLADLSLQQGQLEKAAGHWRQAISISQEPDSWGAIPLPVVGWAYVRLAEIMYEWNELNRASELLEKGLERSELGGDVRAMIAGHILAGKVSLAHGDQDQARQHLDKARALVQKSEFPEWTARFERFQLDYWLSQDQLAEAVRWAEEFLDSGEFAPGPESEPTRLGAVRALLAAASQRTTDQAQELLADLEAAAREQGREGVLLQSLALKAIAYWQKRDHAGAMTCLTSALQTARPEAYTRTFVDLGLPFARLLQEAKTRALLPGQVGNLLGTFEGELSAAGEPSPLTEPLTDREQEVLKHLAAGLTNREIAEKLVISPGTVKKHTANIYGKLNVGSRTAAAARARELSLL